jgi:hypothetical protein
MLDKEEAAIYKEKCEKMGMSYSQIPKEAIQKFLRDS